MHHTPDEHGFVNIGLDTFYTYTIMKMADFIIGEVNENMPRTYGETNFHVSIFTAFVENTNAIPAVPTPQATEIEIKMAHNVVGLIKDRDCIQIGIGAVPAMISKLLLDSGLKDLGVHTEMAPAGVDKLVEKGIVTGKYKKVNPGKIVLTFTMGDKELYDWLGNNPMCEFRQTLYANNISVIAQEDNIVAINGSIEVDLYGRDKLGILWTQDEERYRRSTRLCRRFLLVPGWPRDQPCTLDGHEGHEISDSPIVKYGCPRDSSPPLYRVCCNRIRNS